MAGNASDYLEGQIWKWAFTDASVTRPTEWWVALFSSLPSDAGGGTEFTGAGYARAAVEFDPDTKLNLADVRFTAAGGDFVAGVAYGIFDASSGGNMLEWKPKSIPAVTDGNAVGFAAGDLSGAVD
jgi:hypothetical protein